MSKYSNEATDYHRLHLICGARGIGKTQVCIGLVQLLSLYGEDLAGLISPGVFDDGRKTGIEAYDLRSQERRRLANLAMDRDDTPLMLGKWAFDRKTLAWGDTVLRGAVPCGVLIVDELGPLEFTEGRGWTAGLDALDGRAYRMGVMTIRLELLETACQRWPGAQVHRLESPEDVQPVWTALARAAAEG
jgi:hypothetical protein